MEPGQQGARFRSGDVAGQNTAVPSCWYPGDYAKEKGKRKKAKWWRVAGNEVTAERRVRRDEEADMRG